MSKPAAQGTPVPVPHLAETLVSATVAKWLRKPGDAVEQYDVICELITDKVNVEMPSPVAGVITSILVEEGGTAMVGEAICYIQEQGGSSVVPASTGGADVAAAKTPSAAESDGGISR